jgi:hypothetical protein
MKIVCDVCKTEYKLNSNPNGPVKCVVCGRVWTPHTPINHRQIIKFMAAFCALIAAGIFAFVVLTVFKKNNVEPIFATIDETSTRIMQDKDGAKHIFVSGNITNTTEEMYGVPNIVIVSYDSADNVLSRQTFMPPATFIEAKNTITFNYVLSGSVVKVKRVAVELKETK